jgi:hypothetical protein
MTLCDKKGLIEKVLSIDRLMRCKYTIFLLIEKLFAQIFHFRNQIFTVFRETKFDNFF